MTPEPWVRHEDAHLLAVAKPAGVNTHRADVHAQDGMYEWVQRQRPGVALSILHRLDKETSGVLLFGKTAAANRALGAQFEARTVAKRYELLVGRDARRPASLACDVPIAHPGSSRGEGDAARAAHTDFERQSVGDVFERFAARPHTGRTHQVRIHADALGLPIVGDREHGGLDAARMFLHAAALSVDHPTGGPLELRAARPASFDTVLAAPRASVAVAPATAVLVAREAREVLFDPQDTDCYLWIDRHHDGLAGARVERLGEVALVVDHSQDGRATAAPWLEALLGSSGVEAVYVQHRPRGGGAPPATVVAGAADPRFDVVELGLRYLLDLEASTTSTGLFLDQRETRRRLRGSDLTGKTVLNVFAHTGSLSVAAAAAGAETLTLDLSKRYLDWARENLRANGLDPTDHDFIYGDALDWMARLAKKGRTFDVVLVDPPSSSTTGKRGGTRWIAERDLHDVVRLGTALTAPGGSLFVSTNLHRMRWPRFLEHLDAGLVAAGRAGEIETQTLPLDHRSGPGDPPYLKAAWIRLEA